MKKNLLKSLYGFLFICLLLLNSCRTEDLLQEDQSGKPAIKVSVIGKQQLVTEKHLLDKISHIQSKFNGNNTFGKTVQPDMLQDAIIGTREVMLAEDGDKKTYTFPVYRTYLSDKIENLVLKKNSDGTFSGFLIQYNITKEDRNRYYAGENINLTAKMKVHDIDGLDINISGRVQTDVVGCLEITWETGTCSSDLKHPYGDIKCQLNGDQAAPAPRVISIKDICDQQQTGGETGPGTPPGPGDYGTPGEPYSTFPFVSLYYEYYATEDLSDPNYVHYQKTNQYFQSLPGAIQGLNLSNPDLFYYTYFYFKDNGVSPVTKAFATDRLTKLNNWYIAANNDPNVPQSYNQIILNWAFKYLMIEHPEVTWDEFYNEFLIRPCDKLKNNLQKAKDMMNETDVKNQNDIMTATIATDPKEKGFYFGKNSSGKYKVSDIVEGAVSSVTVNITSTEFTAEAVVHNHNKLDGYTCFSPTDINSFHGYHTTFPAVNHYYVNGGDGSMYVMTIQNQKEYDAFVTKYPSTTKDAFGDWKKGLDIRIDEDNALTFFRKQGISENEAFDLTLGYLSDKYKMGIVISKKGTDGKFHPIQAQSKKITDPATGETKIIYNQINPCNL